MRGQPSPAITLLFMTSQGGLFQTAEAFNQEEKLRVIIVQKTVQKNHNEKLLMKKFCILSDISIKRFKFDKNYGLNASMKTPANRIF